MHTEILELAPQLAILPVVAAGLIAGGASIIGSGIDNWRRRKGQEDANKANKDLAAAQQGWNRENTEAQNKWNFEQWERQNKYNSPKSQMQRYLDAGLNPHLIYGQGSSGNSGALESAQVQNYDRAEAENINKDFSFGRESIGNLATIAQTSVLNSQRNLNNQGAALSAAKTLTEVTKNSQALVNLGYSKDVYEHNLTATIANSNAAVSKAKILEDDVVISSETREKTIKFLNKKFKKTAAEIKSLKAGTARNETLKLIDDITFDLNEQGIYKTDNIIARLLTLMGLTKYITDKF